MGILQIGVVGAGIVGITTALNLQKRFVHAKITIIAENLNENTTSDVAAGLFHAGFRFSPPTEEIGCNWIEYSYKYYSQLLNENCGIQKTSGYILSNIYTTDTLLSNKYIAVSSPEYRPITEIERKTIGANWKYGCFFRTLVINSSIFLPWALNKFKLNGGTVQNRKITNFDDLKNIYDIVFNCTGLGSEILCNDKKLFAVRGQLLKINAPWLDKFYYGDHDTYIIPGTAPDHLASLGGSRHYCSYRTDYCKHDALAILERCRKLLPELSSVEPVKVKIGLRPTRDIIRVEKEIRPNGLLVIHNYGHGAYGITSAPGTSNYAVQLAINSLNSMKCHF